MTAAEVPARVAIVHTSFLAVEPLTRLFAAHAPWAQLRHIVDDSLLPEVRQAGGVTPRVRVRLHECFREAGGSGADLVFSQCSSIGEVADEIAPELGVPLLKIDAPMARRACEAGDRIGVIATLESTLGPTCRLIETTAAELGCTPQVQSVLVDGAFAALESGDPAAHHRAVGEAVRTLARQVDAVVFAQGSMAAALAGLEDLPVPVLTSLPSGVEEAARLLAELRA